MFYKLQTEMMTELESGKKSKSRIYAAACALALAILVPGAAFAAGGDLVTAIEPGLNSLVADVFAAAGIIALVVLAVVGAKVLFGLMKKA